MRGLPASTRRGGSRLRFGAVISECCDGFQPLGSDPIDNDPVFIQSIDRRLARQGVIGYSAGIRMRFDVAVRAGRQINVGDAENPKWVMNNAGPKELSIH